MGVLEARRRLTHAFTGLFHCQRAVALDVLMQVQALNVFHREIVQAVHLGGVVGLDDVRMDKENDRLLLAPEFLNRFGATARCCRSTFSATMRPRIVSHALKTSLTPPSPSRSRI